MKTNRRLRALVVDDETILRRALGLACVALGMETEEAGSMEQALAKLRRTPFDLVIMDRRLPDYEEQGGIRQIRGVPQDGSCLILGLSGDARPEVIEAWFEEGIDLFVEKPMTLSLLKSVVAGLERGEATSGVIRLAHLETSGPVLNPETRQQIEDLGTRTGRELYASMLRELIAAIGAHRVDIRTAVETGDDKRAADAAHALKGCARVIGAWELASFCAHIEQAALATKAVSARHALPGFEAAIEAVLKEASQLPLGG